jgi:insertion element IS1 protein InsB
MPQLFKLRSHTEMHCPYCHSTDTVKNGSNAVGTPKSLCKTCSRQFVENPKNPRISDEQKQLIDKLLLEKISLAGIARAVGVSKRWLQTYVNNKYQCVSQCVKVAVKVALNLTIECDEAWSFVGNLKYKQWVWLAMDRDTREIMGVHVGDRSAEGAQSLWDSLPVIYQQNAICYTDFWAAYRSIFPEDRHYPVGKESGQTNHIERFNNTLRQRVARLVRKTLSFSKKLENHIGAIWYFIHDYNAQRTVEYL